MLRPRKGNLASPLRMLFLKYDSPYRTQLAQSPASLVREPSFRHSQTLKRPQKVLLLHPHGRRSRRRPRHSSNRWAPWKLKARKKALRLLRVLRPLRSIAQRFSNRESPRIKKVRPSKMLRLKSVVPRLQSCGPTTPILEPLRNRRGQSHPRRASSPALR